MSFQIQEASSETQWLSNTKVSNIRYQSASDLIEFGNSIITIGEDPIIYPNIPVGTLLEPSSSLKFLSGLNENESSSLPRLLPVIEIPLIDRDTINMCRRKGLMPYIIPINNIIWGTYRGINHVNLEKIEDPEKAENEKLCFEIHLTSDPNKVLDDEDIFYTHFFNKVPQKMREFFVFIYQVS